MQGERAGVASDLRRRRRHTTAALAVSGAASLGLSGRTSAAPMLLPLGDTSGNYIAATDVSADGSVVIGTGSLPFRWTAAGGTKFVGLDTAISGDGITSIGNGFGGGPTISQGRRHTDATGVVPLPLPGDRTDWGKANALNFDASVIVGQAYFPNNFLPPPPLRGNYAVRYVGQGNATLQVLGDLPGGGIDSAAFGVSGDGSVIVGYGISGLGREAFRYTDATGMVPLADLPGGTFFSSASAVSADGVVVVGYGNPGGGREAFRHTIAGGMVGLGDLPGGGFGSEAKDVNGDGSVIIGTGTTAAGTESFYWTADGGMARLWDVLVAHGVDPALDGWTSLTANALSADGTVVVGGGVRNGLAQPFYAVVPEPAGVALLACAASALAGRRRCTRVA